ncbi:unnamed protein product [Lathyrus oleraceus]
MEIKVVSNHE